MKKNLFEMGTAFEDGWASDNKNKAIQQTSTEIKVPNQHQLHVAKEKRRGKVVTIVKPFYLTKSDLQSLFKVLKKKLATGGTIKENTLEFQGDNLEQVRKYLTLLDYKFK